MVSFITGEVHKFPPLVYSFPFFIVYIPNATRGGERVDYSIILNNGVSLYECTHSQTPSTILANSIHQATNEPGTPQVSTKRKKKIFCPQVACSLVRDTKVNIDN